MTIEQIELEAFRQIRQKIKDFTDESSNDEIAGYVKGIVNLETELYSIVEKERNFMIQNIIISKKEIELIDNLLNMTGNEIYQKYGFKRDETIINHSVKFPNGIEADIKLVICGDEEKPYIEGILFHNGFELICTESFNVYNKEWNFEYDGVEYIVNIIIEE